MISNTKNKFKAGVILGVIISIVIILITEIIFPGIFNNFEAKTFDWRYRSKIENLYHQQKGATIDDIIIIDIDNRSLEKLGRFDRWPRDFHAQVIDYVDSSGALIIGFDILFMERDVNQVTDDHLLAATKKAGNVCYGMSFSRAEPDAFLYKMARTIVGTLLEVGKGNISYLEIKKILEAKNRKMAGKTVPAKGLFLMKVKY